MAFEGGYAAWAVRLEQACDALLAEARWLQADLGGPTDAIRRMIASGIWGGPFADELHAAVGWADAEIVGWGDHLGHLHRALDEAAREADEAARLEAAGVVPSFDLAGALAPWQRWPAVSPPLSPNWTGARAWSGSVVWVETEGAHQLAEGIRVVAEQLRAAQRRIETAVAPVGIDPPPFLASVTVGLDEVADETVRRVTLLENVDRELAGAFRELAQRLGLPGRLAPPPSFDPDDPLDSARAGLVCPATAGPGNQPAQAKEADPVSTSTGNYLHQTLDVVIAGGPGGGVAFGRAYNSLGAASAGALGFGWTHTFDVRLAPHPEGTRIRYGDGREERLPPQDARLRSVNGEHQFTLPSRAVLRFDAAGRLATLSDRSSNQWLLRYDEQGHLVGVDDPSGRELRLESDDDGRIARLTDVLGRAWSYEYDEPGDLVGAVDPAGGRWAYRYDARHQLVAVTDPDGGLVINNAYDQAGRVITQFDSAGARWSYQYEVGRTVVTDPLGRQRVFGVDEQFRTSYVTDASGATTRFTWDAGSHLGGVTEATGRAWQFAHDQKGNVIRTTGPDRSTVAYHYDEKQDLRSVVGADGSELTLDYDQAGRPVSIVAPGGASTTVQWRPDGLVSAVTNGNQATSRFEYDRAGQLSGLVDPLGAITRVTTDEAGQMTTEVHPDGAATAFEWDPHGLLIGVTDPFGSHWRYGYDGAGRLTSVTDALDRTTVYKWDPRGLLTSVTDPLGRTTTFTYDLARRLEAKTDARCVAVLFTWDAFDRLTAVEPADGPPSHFVYDNKGRLASMSDATGTTIFTHDAGDRPVRETRDLGAVTLIHGYDAMSRRRSLHLERGGQEIAVWTYDYDVDGRLSTVTDPAGGQTVLACDAAGNLVGVTHPNGVVSRFVHDSAGQLDGVAHRSAGGDRFADLSFTYDPSGNRTTAGPIRYRYDALDRLTGIAADGEPETTFAYDPLGNRITAEDRVFAYDDTDQIVSDGIYGYEHDAVGNLIARRPLSGGPGDLTASWDALGRLLTLTVDGQTTTFRYDAFGRRTVRSDPKGVTTRIFDGPSVLEERLEGGPGTFETTASLLVLNRISPDGRVEYLHADGNANIGWITDDSGTPRPGPELGPWGEPLNAPLAPGAAGFAGTVGVRAEAGGLLDMRARLYDPHLGRFISRDPWPATLPGPATLNRYAYALNDPVSLLDPSGLFCWTGKNAEGKCRGLKDVAHRVAKPLEVVSTVATVVAVTAVGLTVACPPCAPITLPLAGTLEMVAKVSRGVAIGAGLLATGSECVAAGSITSFDCAKGLIAAGVGRVGGTLIEGTLTPVAESGSLSLLANGIGQYGSGVFDLLAEGTSSAISAVRK